MKLAENLFFQSLKNPYIKTCIELHLQDYVNAYNLDADKLEKEYLVNLGKGNTKRKKLIEDNQKKIDDLSLTEYEKQFCQYMNQILELLVNQKDNKLGLYLIAAYFNQKDLIKNAIVNVFYYNPLVKIALDDFSELMEYWNDPTTLDTLETVNTVDNDHMKHQEEKVIPWQINYTQTSSNKRQSIKL